MKKKKQYKLKAWAVMPDKGKPVFFSRSRDEAKYEAQDVCFMGSQGEPNKIVRCEITYEF